MKINKASKIYLYTVFHFNLAYSAIAEKDFPAVIKRCYEPLLDICEKRDVFLGIEAPGYTLEKIKEISPQTILRWKRLLKNKKTEFIGSGYAQIIGSLVPAEVNRHNLAIGRKIYHSLLGVNPRTAYFNEQAYSSGLIEHYLADGYKAAVMEWNNPYRFHQEWRKEWRYNPQIALSQRGEEIALIWNDSIHFQKFQRYAHGEIELGEYIDYLKSQAGKQARFIPLYGCDAEIFDFRPGRYKTEAKLNSLCEWDRIKILFEKISDDPDFEFILPSGVLKKAKGGNSFNNIQLESCQQPIPVKKQEKYNLTRWALTGRDDLINNTNCYKIYEYLKNKHYTGISEWKELCFLWSSDFRTHIEDNKYLNFQKRMALMLAKEKRVVRQDCSKIKIKKFAHGSVLIKKNTNSIEIENKNIKLNLNCKKGLAIDYLIFKKVSDQPLIVTLPHGYYDDISLGADFYSGHTVIEAFGKRKITDLDSVNTVSAGHISGTEIAVIKAVVDLNNLGKVSKEIVIFDKENRIDLNYEFDFASLPPCLLRSGIITFNPKAFDKKNLYYSCRNGGTHEEKFLLGNKKVAQNEPVSFLVSSSGVLGNTSGCLEIADNKKSVKLQVNMAKLAILPMINFIPQHSEYFMRVLFSLGEVDETSRFKNQGNKIKTGISITASPT